MPKILQSTAPAAAVDRTVQINGFRGVDLTGGITEISMQRSPDSLNMMPDLDGFPVKRKGYSLYAEKDGKINGAYILKLANEEKRLIHAGTKLYCGDEIVYSSMNNEKSCAVQLDEKLIIADGKRLLCFAKFENEALPSGFEYTAKPCDTVGEVPVITIGRKPSGGGSSYNPPNLLSSFVQENFLSDGSSKAYQLSYTDLAENAEVSVWIMAQSGDWQLLAENAYTVDCTKGIINFNTAPSLSPVTGEDNIKIRYRRAAKENFLNFCDKLTLYGVNGQPDRVFLSGKSAEGNRVWYSQFKNPLYIGDVWYICAGQSKTEVTGFSIVENMLAVHKKDEENGRNTFLLYGDIDDNGDAKFPIKNILLGEGALGGFASLAGEPLFLTKQGVFALTKSDTTAERYTQNRSYYINAELVKLKNIEKAAVCVYGRFYIIADGSGKVYLLDSRQKSFEKNCPYSTFQYECYVWDNIPATAVWTWGDELYFGSENGSVYKFNTQSTAAAYSDCGKPIKAYWTTPLMAFSSFSNYKSISDIWIVCRPYSRSGAEVYYATDKEVKRKAAEFNIDILNWNDIDFNRFTFNTTDRPCIKRVRIRAKKVKLFMLYAENSRLNEPFGLASVTIDYKLMGKIK